MPSINLHAVDYALIGVYLAITFLIGFLAERRASASGKAFFLGDNKLPWWALGASGMASNVDISGTALAVGLIYAMGVKGYFLEIRGGIVLVMAVLLAFMGKWNRRSGVMTRAEWMIFRFGDGTGGKLARLASAAAEMLFAIWVTAYFAKGLEIFVGPLTPFNPSLVSAAIVVFVMIYSMAGGLTGVVWTDVFQGLLIMVAVLYVAALALLGPTLPDAFTVSIPMGEGAFAPLAVDKAAWASAIPPLTTDMPGKYADYNLFGFTLGIFLIRTVIDGMSGSGGYMIQRYLAAKSEREAGLISAFWIFLLMFRWPMVIGFAVLGIRLSLDTGVIIENPEAVMPTVIEKVMPIGLKGLIVACFLAAFMSTLSSFLNSSAAYWVQDVYKPFLKPDAGKRAEVWHGRGATLMFVVLGLATAYGIEDLNDIWGWLTAALTGGLGIPFLLRWYWSRFNGEGFALGTLFGNVAAVATMLIPAAKGLTELQLYGTVCACSLTGCLLGTFLFSPTKQAVLDNYFRVTRPFGFWGRCRKTLEPARRAAIKRENVFELLSMFLALPWQLLLFMVPMLIIIHQWVQAAVLGTIVAILSVLLYFTWYRNLSPEEDRVGEGSALAD